MSELNLLEDLEEAGFTKDQAIGLLKVKKELEKEKYVTKQDLELSLSMQLKKTILWIFAINGFWFILLSIIIG